MILFSGGNIFITLSYLFSGLLILALIVHTIWRGQNVKKKIAELTRQQNLDASAKTREETV